MLSYRQEVQKTVDESGDHLSFKKEKPPDFRVVFLEFSFDSKFW
jgi:hypothetical protein